MHHFLFPATKPVKLNQILFCIILIFFVCWLQWFVRVRKAACTASAWLRWQRKCASRGRADRPARSPSEGGGVFFVHVEVLTPLGRRREFSTTVCTIAVQQWRTEALNGDEPLIGSFAVTVEPAEWRIKLKRKKKKKMDYCDSWKETTEMNDETVYKHSLPSFFTAILLKQVESAEPSEERPAWCLHSLPCTWCILVLYIENMQLFPLYNHCWIKNKNQT